MWAVDFDKTPFLVIWETTQACDLACRHCRACAVPGPIPGELSTKEGFALIDQVADLGTPLLVLSGGDPAARPDLIDLVRYGKQRGLRVATIPAATPRLTPELIHNLKDAGLDQIAFSLDFPRAQLHDGFRGVPGVFQKTLDAFGWARAAGLPAQINTCVWKGSAPYLEETGDLVEKLGAAFWEVFFLVPTGRGTAIDGLTPWECEDLFEILRTVQARKKFILKVTEAPHYRRFLAQHHDHENGRARHHGTVEGPSAVPLAHRGVNSGNGFMFVSHYGEVFPSGFLPLSCGNVRHEGLAKIYREFPLFRALRDPSQLTGRCGACPFGTLCGGSRSRAFALTGNPLAEDGWCAFDPGAVSDGPVGSRVG